MRKEQFDSDKEYQKRYYREKREELREKKRKRYQEDEEYRKKALARSKRQYWLKTRPAVLEERGIPGEELAQIEPSGYVEIEVKNEDDRRFGKTVKVPVYSSSKVAELLGRSAQTIRIWERRGVLPGPRYRGRDFESFVIKGRNPRIYTYDEMKTMEECREMLLLPAKNLESSPFAACLREGFATLVDGLKVLPREG